MKPEKSNGDATQGILDAAVAEGEIGNVGNALLSGALVNMAEGRNEAVRYSNYPHPEDIPVLAFIMRSAPPILAKMACDKITAASSQKEFAHRIPDILQNARQNPQGAGNFLKKLLRGDAE